MLIPKQKLRVFVSSECSTDNKKQKYNLARRGLKLLIESTQLATVYLFEDEGSSTTKAKDHYLKGVEESDICIFFIDNQDARNEIPKGVQAEVDLAKKLNKRSLFYFCNQRLKKKTPLQKSLSGGNQPVHHVVGSFEEFIEQGASDFINELVSICHDYCSGRLVYDPSLTLESSFCMPGAESNSIDISRCEPTSLLSKTTGKQNESADAACTNFDELISDAPESGPLSRSTQQSPFSTTHNIFNKAILGSICNCKNYFSKMILQNLSRPKTVDHSTPLDELLCQVLPVLLEAKPLEKRIMNDLKKELETQHSSSFFEVISKRLDAITWYFHGDQVQCISCLEEALSLSKKNALPVWFTKDILIDLRNQTTFLGESQNRYDNTYQLELDQDNQLLNYPVLDRLISNYYDFINKNTMDSMLKSPYTTTFGNNLGSAIDLLAGIYAISLLNGSLTHLLQVYKYLSTLSFYCSKKNPSLWSFRVLLLQTTLINHITREADRVLQYFDDILCKMDASDAAKIYQFTENLPIPHRRFMAQLDTLGAIGYFLDDIRFQSIWASLYALILTWIEDDNACAVVGDHLFKSLPKISRRIDQHDLLHICLRSIQKSMQRYWQEIFSVLASHIHLDQLSKQDISLLMSTIISLVSTKKEEDTPAFRNMILSLRVQDKECKFTCKLDEAVAKHMPDFYDGDYKLKTTKDVTNDMPLFIQNYISEIQGLNEEQGKNGAHFEYGDDPYLIIKNILKSSSTAFDGNLLNSLFLEACNTLLCETQLVKAKRSAISLLLYLVQTYPALSSRNQAYIKNLIKNKETVESGARGVSNMNNDILRVSAQFLYLCFGYDDWNELIDALAALEGDYFSLIHASSTACEYLEAITNMLDPRLEAILLQNAVTWSVSANSTIRLHAVEMLISMIHKTKSSNTICKRLFRLFDNDQAYIKILILRYAEKIESVDEATYQYILQKASKDPNFLVRKAATEKSVNHHR